MAIINSPFGCFNQRAGIAILTLNAINELSRTTDRECLTSIQICERVEISVSYFEQVIRSLLRAGWVQSVRGAGGGFKLLVDLSSLSLYDFLTTFDKKNQPCSALASSMKFIAVSDLK